MGSTSPEQLRHLAANFAADSALTSKADIVNALREYAHLMEADVEKFLPSDAQILQAAQAHYRERSGYGDWGSLSEREINANLRWMRSALKTIWNRRD